MLFNKVKIEHFRSAPFSFEPPKTSNVSETYLGPALKNKTLKSALDLAVQKDRPFLGLLLKLRNMLVKRFGIKTDFSGDSPYGPFDVSFPESGKEEEVIVKYDDPHFSFYAEAKNKESALTLHTSVHFKTPTGMVYFWSIYLFHVQVFKSFMKGLYS